MKKEKISGLTAVYRKVKDGYVAYVEEISGVNTQGSDLRETKENLQDALRLVLETNREIAEKETKGEKVIKEKITSLPFLQSFSRPSGPLPAGGCRL